jgi:hypothetical protein
MTSPITHYSRVGIDIEVAPRAILVRSGVWPRTHDLVLPLANVAAARVDGFVKKDLVIVMNNGETHKLMIATEALALLAGINEALR